MGLQEGVKTRDVLTMTLVCLTCGLPCPRVVCLSPPDDLMIRIDICAHMDLQRPTPLMLLYPLIRVN